MRTSNKRTSIQDKVDYKKQSRSLFSKPARCQQSSKIIQLPFKQTMLKLNPQEIIKAIETHRWRAATSLPIIRTITYTVSPELFSKDKIQLFRSGGSIINHANKTKEETNINLKIIQYIQEHQEIAFYRLTIKIQAVRCRLSEIAMLPFSQSVYLLKEMLIGFQVLVDLFGIFNPTERMVVINDQGHWKMWINQNYSINQKQSSQISEKKFIQKLILMCEHHCIPSTQSKLFFGMTKQFTESNECKFVKMLEKVSQFVSVNKIYLVSKVILPLKTCNTVNNAQKSEKTSHINGLKNNKTPNNSPSKINICQKTVILKKGSDEGKKGELSNSITFNQKNNAENNRNHCNHLNNELEMNTIKKQNHEIQNVKMMNEGKKVSIWKPKSADYGKAIPHEPKKLRLEHNEQKRTSQSNSSNNNIQYNKNKTLNVSFMPNAEPSLEQIPKINFLAMNINHSQVNINESTKNREYIKHFNKDQNTIKPVFEQSFKKPNLRRYSEQIGTINIQEFSQVNKYSNSSSYSLSYNSFQFKKESTNKQQNGAHMIAQFNNSWGSTKHFVTSEDIKQSHKISYWKLKIKDIGEKEEYNNQSFVKSQTFDQNAPQKRDNQKNNDLTTSFQFDHRMNQNPQSGLSQNQKNQFAGLNKWKNTISGLFNQNASIRQLTESIQCKSKQEQVFEKDFLKDVKLDMLQKFGRNVHHIVEDTSYPEYGNSSKKGEGHQSMTLIEEEQEEGKSYFDEDQNNEETEFKIKVNRSRHLTVQPILKQKDALLQPKEISIRQCRFLQKDDEADFQIVPNNGGFDFESQQYVISPVEPL